MYYIYTGCNSFHYKNISKNLINKLAIFYFIFSIKKNLGKWMSYFTVQYVTMVGHCNGWY